MSDAVTDVLARQAADTRRQTAYYGNVRALPGASARPGRLLSDIGFQIRRTFAYVAPATSLVMPHDPPRPITSITLHPYGLDEDYRRLTATSAAGRRVRSDGGGDTPGVRTHPSLSGVVVSAALDDALYAVGKTARLIDRLTTSGRGPAYHVVISRRGDVIVAALFDHATSAASANAETTLDVALEGALALRRDAFDARQFDAAFNELPYTVDQMLALSAFVVKTRTAYPAIPLTLAAGLVNQWPGAALANATAYNFSGGAWRGDASLFDHTLSDAPAFFTNLAAIPPFDLATEVFRADGAPPPTAARVLAAAAINQADTAGERSVLLANYATLAAPERAADMQSAARSRFFVERIRTSSRDSDATSGAAADTAAASRIHPLAPTTDVEPYTYDFTTGRWSDDGAPF